jgi:hypothetical protein
VKGNIMELLGLIDALEATLLSSPKLVLTDKIIISENKVLSMLDKIRLVIKNGGKITEEQLQANRIHSVSQDEYANPIQEVLPSEIEEPTIKEAPKNVDTSREIIDLSKKEAKEIIEHADQYAENVLEKLHLSILKMQRNISRVERTISDSKQSVIDDPIKSELME